MIKLQRGDIFLHLIKVPLSHVRMLSPVWTLNLLSPPFFFFLFSLRSQFAACCVWTLCSSLISMKCLKVRFVFPTAVTENHPVVGYDTVRSDFRIFVMNVARSFESSTHLHTMPWHGVGPVWASEARRRLLGVALKLGCSRQRNTDARNA
jgi:hypothetical protein